MIPYLVDKSFDLSQLFDKDGKAIYDKDNLAIFVQTRDPSVPVSNGVGVLAETEECTAKNELNGEDEIELKYPITGELFNDFNVQISHFLIL